MSSLSDLRKLSLSEFASRCTQLISDMESFGSALNDFGITQQVQDELILLLQGIDELNNSTRHAIIKRKGLTQGIINLEQAINTLLRVEVDRLMLIFKDTAPEFYQDFQNARITIDYGSHPTKGSGSNDSAA